MSFRKRGLLPKSAAPATARRRGGWVAAGVAVAALILALIAVVPPARAIEELEAEQDISDLLPAKFPGEEEVEAASRRWALLPQLGFGPDTGALLGAKFAHRDLLGSGITLDVDATWAVEGQQGLAFSVGSPNLFNRSMIVLLRGKYDLDPQREFFGIGNNDVGPEPLTTHLFQEIGGSLTVGWRPFERVAFNFSFGVRKVDIRRGDRKEDLPFTPDPPPPDMPDAPDFSQLPGIDGGIVNPIALSLVWNTRDDVMRPTHGWRFILKVIHTNKTLLSDFDYTRYVADAGYLRYMSEARRVILGVRVNGEWIDAPDRRVPFWELAELGGQDTLRGFFPHRFVGKGRILLNGEARFKLIDFNFLDWWHVKVDGVLFGDGGRVFLDRGELSDEFEINTDIVARVIDDFQYSYGGGVRIALSDALVARIDAGFSNEETGLIYLSFGHTF